LKRLYDGSDEEILARIIDTSIQFAWGLHYAHELGLIHQDVKPLNALMWDDGTLKVTDFGLAGGRAIAGIETANARHNSIMVSSGAMTQAFCSPEQAAGHKLDRRTDIWSWAVSVLEMFQGEVLWQSGVAAPHALEFYLENVDDGQGIPTMPMDLAQLLRQCFQLDPQARPATLHECASTLCAIFTTEIGIVYHRIEPPVILETADSLNNKGLSLLDLGKPTEAKQLFDRALQIDNCHPQATFNRGIFLWRRAEIDDATVLDSLEQMLRDSPNNPIILSALGWICMENGDFEQARDHFEKAATVKTDSETQNALNQACAAVSAITCHDFQLSSIGQTEEFVAAAFSPDEKLIVTSGLDKTLKVWTIADKQCTQTSKELSVPADRVAFSQHSDSVIFATDTSIGQWNCSTGEMTIRQLEQFALDNALTLSSISPGEESIFTNDELKALEIWNIEKGKYREHQKTAAGAFSPDGYRYLQTVLDGSVIKLLNLSSKEYESILEGHAGDVTAATFSSNAQIALSFSEIDKTIRIWDVHARICRHTINTALQHKSLVIAPNALYALSYSSYNFFAGTLLVWNLTTGRCIRTFKCEGGSICIISPNSRYVLCGGDVTSWDCQFYNLEHVVDNCHIAPWFYSPLTSSRAAYDRQTKYDRLITQVERAIDKCDFSNALLLIQKARSIPGYERSQSVLSLKAQIGARSYTRSCQGTWLKSVLKGHSGSVRAGAFFSNGKFALSGSEDCTLRLWDIDKNECINIFKDKKLSEVYFLALSPDNQFALARCKTGVALWNITSGTMLNLFKCKEGYGLAFSPDGSTALLAASKDSSQLWSIETGEIVQNIGSGCSAEVGFTPDGRFVIFNAKLSSDGRHALSESGTPSLWDISTGLCIREFQDSIASVTSCGHPLRLWDVSTGQCIRYFDGHELGLINTAFLPDGRYVVSACGDAQIKLCDCSTGNCIRTFDQLAWVFTVAFSPDGRYLLSGGSDHLLRIWEIDWEYEYYPDQDRTMQYDNREAMTIVDIGHEDEMSKIDTLSSSYENSLGITFVPVPGTNVLFSVWDTRVKDYAAFVEAVGCDAGAGWKNPGFEQTGDHPVVNVSWDEAKAFCKWLTRSEQCEGRIGKEQVYRLPTDAEWSVAVGSEKYPWGNEWPPPKDAGNYDPSLGVDLYENTSPVGSFLPNLFGLYDIGGNVWQWGEDSYSATKSRRVVHGASWCGGDVFTLLSSRRFCRNPGARQADLGFRCVLVGGSLR
jgi:WD40 repeat protein/serine/threonine protein kinase